MPGAAAQRRRLDVGPHLTVGVQSSHRSREKMDKANCQVASEQGERAKERRGDGAAVQLGYGK